MKPFTKKFTAAAVILGVAISSVSFVAYAKDHKRGGKGARINFEEVDTNSDGEITKAEMQAHAGKRFASSDTNSDGFIDRTEIIAKASTRAAERAQKRADRMLERLDANDDGKLSQEEMANTKRGNKLFERADADDSGSISKAEFEAMKKHRKGRKGKKGDKKKEG